MKETTGRSVPNWQRWAIYGAALLGIGAPILALLLGMASGARLIDWRVGLGSLRPLSLAAMAGCTIALVAMLLLALRRKWRRLALPFATVVVSAAFVSIVAYNFGKAEFVPMIHDITTDIVDPPRFQTLSLREDNLETVPLQDSDSDLEGLDNVSRWRLLHLRHYGDIRPIIVAASVPETVEEARRLILDRGWKLVVSEPASGRIEATATVSIYRFKDDVVLRITPDPNGLGSIVHMRSVSRVGVSDLGVNADRVRNFLGDLQERLG